MLLRTLCVLSIVFAQVYNCYVDGFQSEDYDESPTAQFIKEVEENYLFYTKLAAQLTWELSTNPSEKSAKLGLDVFKSKNTWKNDVCSSPKWNLPLTKIQQRKLYLLCRDEKLVEDMPEMYITLMGALNMIYNSEICLPVDEIGTLDALANTNQNTSGYPKPGQCVHGEPDLERLMKRSDLNADQLKWTWKTWHNAVGAKMREPFVVLNKLENIAAKLNNYDNIGEVWKDELEIPNLEEVVFGIYGEIEPLYRMLHGVVRHKLLVKYGSLEVDPLGPIPVHLLGNMWGQDWSKLIDLFLEPDEMIDLDQRLQAKNWTVRDMVLQAEDMYTSLGLHPMTKVFWRYSIFEKNENLSICHGTAAYLYRKDDVRILMCGKVDMENFYVIHHEMGHIEYFLAYQNQSPIFQAGANSAMHESIGDAIMHSVMSPQHLHRLGLITDAELAHPKTDLFLLLTQALEKIPELPYALMTDKYRWDIFKGSISEHDYNTAYWEMSKKLRGVVPPERRGEEFFDAAGKFHLADNTPYIRYFLSGVLQMDIYKGLCEISLYGSTRRVAANDGYEQDNAFPLHRCDLYGSKKCGKHLLAMMQKGSSLAWPDALNVLIGRKQISTEPLMEYYRPLYNWLKRYIEMNNIPIGW